MKSNAIAKLEATLGRIAEEVYAELGSGHDEKVYHRAMEVDLRLRGIEYDSEYRLDLLYKDHYVGENYADLIVHSDGVMVVVELKAAKGEMGPPEEQQLRKYMKILGKERGLLINFPQMPRKKSGDPMKPQIVPISQHE